MFEKGRLVYRTAFCSLCEKPCDGAARSIKMVAATSSHPHDRLRVDFSMSINQRQHIRFSLDIPANLILGHGGMHVTNLQQISIGGCFADWEENIYTGDEFRLEVDLPNGNRLPLRGKAVYIFENTGIGVRFVDITEFEQRLISKIIAHHFKRHGVPMTVDPFKTPSQFVGEDDYPMITDRRLEREKKLQDAMASD